MKKLKVIIAVIVIAVGSLIVIKQNKKGINQDMKMKVNEFVEVELKSDLSVLSYKQKEMLPLLFEAAEIMDSLFWLQAYGNRDKILSMANDEYTKKLILINYGPWERLNGNKPFIEGVGEKPAGATFYPLDMTEEEFNNLNNDEKTSLYSVIRRDTNNNLIVIPYHEFFKNQVIHTSELLKKASELAEDEGFKKYLKLRSQALVTDDYFVSDIAWMEMKNNIIDFVVGPIENYEDQLYGYKAAYEAYILIKDQDWSKRLDKYTGLLPKLQKNLPVEEKYKKETPGSGSDLGAYDVIYYAGDCNAGAKTIAINLPNDERVHLEKGSRRLQLKNAMKAKFDKILLPITDVIISEDQRKYVTFDAFFANTMFHEVAHGLGIKETINGKGTVREALKEQYSALEEGKADILGLFMVTKLNEWGELQTDLMENYVTFMAGIFRSIRFGASSAHGRANLLRYNYFLEKGAFSINEDGTYSINFDKMKEAMESLSELILTIQGNGDYDNVVKLMEQKAIINTDLQKALENINSNHIPVDVWFKQGMKVLGL